MINVSNVINMEFINKFHAANVLIFCLSTLCLGYYGFIVIVCSNRKMRTFRILMLIYVFCCFNLELVIFLWKPIRFVFHWFLGQFGSPSD